MPTPAEMRALIQKSIDQRAMILDIIRQHDERLASKIRDRFISLDDKDITALIAIDPAIKCVLHTRFGETICRMDEVAGHTEKIKLHTDQVVKESGNLKAAQVCNFIRLITLGSDVDQGLTETG